MTTEDIVRAVVDVYPGGAAGFWRAWAAGRLDPRVCEYVRRHAAHAGLGDDLARADAAAEQARGGAGVPPRQRQLAAEAVAVATPSPGRITAQAGGPAYEVAELRERVRAALFDLLTGDLDLRPPPGESEADAGTRLVRHLFHELAPDDDPAPLPSFQDLLDWVDDLRFRADHPDPSAADVWARAFAACYLRRRADDPDEYRYQPSFRLFVRGRLKRCCVRDGWEPRAAADGGRFGTLDEAFAALTRERIAATVERVEWRALAEWLAADPAGDA